MSIHFVRCINAPYLLALLLFCAPTFAGPGAHGPGGEHLDSPATIQANGPQRLVDGSVYLPKAAQRRLEIRTRLIQTSQAAKTLNLPAQVIPHPNGFARVQSPHAGLLLSDKNGLPLVGQTVKQGQLLAKLKPQADLYEYANVQAKLKELQAEQDTHEKSLARMLLVPESVAAKEIEALEIRIKGLKQQQQVLLNGLQTTTLFAPISGVISQVNVAFGQQLAAQQTLFEITDPQQLLVQARSPDPALAQQISHAFIANGGQLSFIGASPVLQEGLLPLLFRPQDKIPLAIGQPLSLIVQLKQSQTGLVVPTQAVVRNSNNEYMVWIKVGAERFVPQPIRFQPLDSQNVLIQHGLASDNRVVIQGAALLAQIR